MRQTIKISTKTSAAKLSLERVSRPIANPTKHKNMSLDFALEAMVRLAHAQTIRWADKKASLGSKW
jgi:hypothetical protein